MPFTRSSLQTIINRIISDFKTRITGATSLLRSSTLNIIARVNAGAFHLMYEYLDFQAKQLFVSTADTAALEAHASEYGITRNAAVAAQGSGQATGNDVTIPAGSELISTDGNVYTTDADVTISGGVGTLDFTASEAGADSNEDGGILLSFVSPIAGVNTTVTVDSDGITGGTDEESDTLLRIRVLARKRNPPHGGASFDYENWALEVSGVTRAWAFSQYAGVGTIGLAFVRDGDTPITPDAAQRLVVYNYIVEHEDPTTGLTVGIPVTAEPGFSIIELTEYSLNFDISLSPNTVAVQALVEAALEDLLLRSGGPGETLYLSQISEVISLVPSEVAHSVNSPATDITVPNTQVYVLGTVTFSSY